MPKTFLWCDTCKEIFTNEETLAHKEETGHNSWSHCRGGASKMWTLWGRAIMPKTDYLDLVEEILALRRKVERQTEILADTRNRMLVRRPKEK